MLREKVNRLDAIILTHEHKDHIAGLDDVRAFNYKSQAAIDIYSEDRVQKALQKGVFICLLGNTVSGYS